MDIVHHRIACGFINLTITAGIIIRQQMLRANIRRQQNDRV